MKSNNRHHKPNESLKLSLSYTIIGLWPVDKQIIRPQAQGIVVMVEILKLTNQSPKVGNLIIGIISIRPVA